MSLLNLTFFFRNDFHANLRLTPSQDTGGTTNQTLDIVTIEGNVININVVPQTNRKITVTSEKINVTEGTDFNNNITFVPNKNYYNKKTETTTINSETSTETMFHEVSTTDIFTTSTNTDIFESISNVPDTDFAYDTTQTSTIFTTVEELILEDFSTTEDTNVIYTSIREDTGNSLTENKVSNSETNEKFIVLNVTNDNLIENEVTTFENEELNTSTTAKTNAEFTSEDHSIKPSEDTTAFISEPVNTTAKSSISSPLSSKDYDDEWVYIDELESDEITIPEMPILSSDPMALKELPRPMTFEGEESSRKL